jgi:hypothetical protein
VAAVAVSTLEHQQEHMTRTHLLTVAVVGGALLPACWSQGLPASLDFTKSNAEGLRIYSLSTFFGYSKFDAPQAAVNSSNPFLTSRKAYGVSGSIGWQRFRGRTAFSFRYTGSYSGVLRDTNWNGANHTASFTLTRPFARKWTIDFRATGQDTFFEQFLFDPTSLAAVAQTPATFDNLAAAMSVGQFTSSDSAVLLNSSATAASATRSALLGSHIYTYGANAGISYEPSKRWNIRLGGFTLAGQQRSGDSIPGAQLNYILPRTTGGDLSVAVDFFASPRTSIDFTVLQNYISSRFQQSSGTAGSIGLGRKMGRHWFLRGSVGSYVAEHQTGGVRQKVQTIGSGSLGWTTYGNTFVGSFTRSGYDMTLGTIGTNTTLSVAWNWRRPRNNWGLNAAFSRIENSSAGLSSLNGWQTTGGFSERLPGNLFVTANYTHLSSRGTYLNFANRINIDGARITLGWAPQRRRSAPADVALDDDSKGDHE